MDIVFLGPPGVGKGTQCKQVAQKYGWPHLSTGEIMRSAIAAGTKLGQQVQSFVSSGKLVPDQVVLDIVADRIRRSDCKSGCIFDGFPRTVQQAQMLDKLLQQDERGLAAVLQLMADDAEVTRRLMSRSEIEGRSDDSPATIAHRLDVYHSQTSPLTAFYRDRGLLVEIDGTGTPEQVFANIVAEIDQLRRK
jgi:adenylate kinase